MDGVDIFVGGRAGPDPKLAVKIMENIHCDLLPGVLEQIIPYHTREKMHRVKGQRKRKIVGKKTEESVRSEIPIPQKSL